MSRSPRLPLALCLCMFGLLCGATAAFAGIEFTSPTEFDERAIPSIWHSA